MKGSVIVARENWPGAPIKEICRCNGNAKDIRNALADYTVSGAGGTPIHKYNHVEILDLALAKKAAAEMKDPNKNIARCIGTDITVELLRIFEQIDNYRLLMRKADADGEQAAQGQAAQERPPLPQRQSEAES
jgi:hypothetical protein